MSIQNQDSQKRVADAELKLTSLTGELQKLNKRLEDTQVQWADLIALHTETSARTPVDDIVVYQETFDEERQTALLPSSTYASNKSMDEVFSEINRSVYHQMQCANGLSSGSLAGSLSEYRNILEQIVTENPDIKFLTAFELSQVSKDGKSSYCQIRHDVDADLVACLLMAEIEADLGIKSTYFLLHTAIYFGEWQVDHTNTTASFLRNEALAEYYLKLQELGHEVAIHTDPLHLYQNLNIDGAKALVADIDWLRSQKININGTAPHNNPDEYGAANSAIFVGRPINTVNRTCYQGVIKNGQWAALGRLKESNLGLKYEADDIFTSTHGMSVDFISLVSEDKWYRFFKTPDLMDWEKLRRGHKRHHYYMNSLDYWRKELQDIYKSENDLYLTSGELPNTFKQRAPKITVLSIHPEHFGYRENENSFPSLDH